MLHRKVLYSTGCKYAISAAVFLARHHGAVASSHIAEQCHIAPEFLSSVLQRLVKGGILFSSKGPYGGFYLRRDPARIRLWDLVESVDEENCCRE